MKNLKNHLEQLSERLTTSSKQLLVMKWDVVEILATMSRTELESVGRLADAEARNSVAGVLRNLGLVEVARSVELWKDPAFEIDDEEPPPSFSMAGSELGLLCQLLVSHRAAGSS